MDAGFGAGNARFGGVDGRSAAWGDPVGGTDRSVAMAERFAARFGSIDELFAASPADVDHVRQRLGAQIDAEHRRFGWVVLLGLLGTTLSTVSLCLGTLVLVLVL